MKAFTLLLVLLAPGAGKLSAKGLWAMVTDQTLDPRIGRELDALARQHQAELHRFPSFDEAVRRHARLTIELRQPSDVDTFLRDLTPASAAAGVNPEPAREGYRLETVARERSVPSRITITTATAAGLHLALLRIPALLRVAPGKLELMPQPKSVTRTRSGRRSTTDIVDFPSFPERGIVEGFYGTPWTHHDRLEILRFEEQHGMNVYYYAPKDDPYHRRLWREPYPPAETKRLEELVGAARDNFVNFCFAVSPGLSMVYSNNEDFEKLTAKLESVGKLGVSCFALFLDDVAQELENPDDRARYRTLAEAHVDLINRLDHHLKSLWPENRLVVTPTTYTGEWGNRDYVRELGAGVNADVDIVWTGPRVVSPVLTVADATEWGQLLGRPPLVWDNFPVNDGITWRPNLGPLVGRDPNLPTAVRGLFSNPMNQARASLIALQTIADYLWNSFAYDPKRSLNRAVTEQYGRDAPRLLAPFLKTYGDYWWDESVFRPLFVAERRPIVTREIERRLAVLDRSLRSLDKRSRFRSLVADLAPFPRRTRERLAQVRADPAFRRRPDQTLERREGYDALQASRLMTLITLDGDFGKWRNGPLYSLDRAPQLVAGAKLWRGPDQFSCRLALGWDDQYLYVGADVTDPELYQPFRGRDIDKGDAVIVTLETAFRKNFSKTQADGDEYRLLFSPGNFAGVEPSVFSDEDYLPPRPAPRDYGREIKAAWRKTATGFSGDIAIPVTWFDGGKFESGYEIGLSFAAQKVLERERAGGQEENARMTFTSNSDRLFPVRLSNPSSYQRLVLVNERR